MKEKREKLIEEKKDASYEECMGEVLDEHTKRGLCCDSALDTQEGSPESMIKSTKESFQSTVNSIKPSKRIKVMYHDI